MTYQEIEKINVAKARMNDLSVRLTAVLRAFGQVVLQNTSMLSNQNLVWEESSREIIANNALMEKAILLRQRFNEVTKCGLEPTKKANEMLYENTAMFAVNTIAMDAHKAASELLKFQELTSKANNFNTKLDEQKLAVHLAAMEMRGLSGEQLIGAQMAHKHEQAKLQQMKTTKNLQTAMGALSAVMGASGLGKQIGNLISSWRDMSPAQRVAQISTMALTAAMTALAIAKVASQSGLGAKIAIPLTVVALAAGTASAIAAVRSNVPKMATGGVISAPTMALVGEGRYPEAVVPLGSSPQFASMKTDIANAVLQGIMAFQGNSTNSRKNNFESSEIVLNIDGTRLARVMLPQLSNEQKRLGYSMTLREV